MKFKDIKEQKGTLTKLNNLIKDTSKQVYGVTYTNTFFTQRYLARSQVVTDEVDVTKKQVDIKLTMRLEKQGLREVENTLNMLVKFRAGDMPGFSPEGSYSEDIDPDGTIDRPNDPEIVSTTQSLFSADLLLLVKDPDITFKEFTIAGSKFTLIELHNQFDEDFYQTTTLLYGDIGKMYFLSHFYETDLNTRDARMVLEMIADDNMTGKAIKGVRIDTTTGASSTLYPVETLIGAYKNVRGDIVFNTETGYVKLPTESLDKYTMMCEPLTKAGDYTVRLKSKTETITLFIE